MRRACSAHVVRTPEEEAARRLERELLAQQVGAATLVDGGGDDGGDVGGLTLEMGQRHAPVVHRVAHEDEQLALRRLQLRLAQRVVRAVPSRPRASMPFVGCGAA
jgi:hypothetical protein